MSTTRLQVWGGIECTVNRVGDFYMDQCERSGHAKRIEDLDLIAELGIRTLRYPILWEKIAPNGLATADWTWADRRLERLRELGIKPIVGLIHHGSGPRQTSLIDPKFEDLLAEFAYAVGERYPWIEMYTPVNEPLTTARFSALYGHWYPHLRDDVSFYRTLMNQLRAVVKSMRAIRISNPKAALIQTEDMQKVYSTSILRYQANFENERRWLSLDLLNGRKLSAKIEEHLLTNGVTESEIAGFLEDDDVRPDVNGINHYITSERFLDHRLDRYPEWSHGGNGRHYYADVEAVRVIDEIDNIKGLLEETWERYRKPISITEAHIGDTVPEQKRWLWERWIAAQQCRDKGIDIRAVTVWALFGSFDWDSLVTKMTGHYEAGVFDVSGPEVTRTGLYEMVKDLATNGEHIHEDLSQHGWWNRPERWVYPKVARDNADDEKELAS